jgi:hypothetical protein
MADQTSDLQQDYPQVKIPRKPWHAPQFIRTDVADTDTVGGAPSDTPLGGS